MSDKDIKQEKVVTKYDRKMQRRQAEKEKEQRQKKIATAVGVVIAVVLVAWIASFPIRTYLANHETYIIINGEEITKAEFDYYYNSVVNQYSAYLGLGITFSEDTYEEETVENMKRIKALKADADAAGYTYDASGEIADFKDTLKATAKSEGVSTNKFLKQVYGPYASMSNVTRYMEENARVNAYYEELSKKFEPSDEEILAYYEEKSADYDVVDYYVSTFSPELSEDLSDEAIDAALDEAFERASEAEVEIRYNGDKEQNVKRNAIPSVISNWLFDESRREGDTTVIDNTDDYMYYVLGFEQRHRDETPMANVRVITIQNMDGQTILEEWGAGAATEESFAEIANKYNTDNTDGGLQEEVTKDSVNADMAGWIFANGRRVGDTGCVTTEDGYTYVMYYAKQLDPEWKHDIKNTLIGQAREEYVNNLVESIVVEDPKGNLNYLKVNAAEEAAVSDGDVSDGDVSEGDVSDNDISDGDVSDSDVSDSDIENADDMEGVEDGVSDGDVPED